MHLYGVPKISKFIEIEGRGCQGLKERPIGVMNNGYRVSVGDDEKFLPIDSGDGYRTL